MFANLSNLSLLCNRMENGTDKNKSALKLQGSFRNYGHFFAFIFDGWRNGFQSRNI